MEEGSAYVIFSTGGRPGNSNDTYSVQCSWGLLSASAVTRDVGSLQGCASEHSTPLDVGHTMARRAWKDIYT